MDSTEAIYSNFMKFEEEFRLDREPVPENFAEVPESEDAEFDFINMDASDLQMSKKTNFWKFLIENLGVHIRYGKKLSIGKRAVCLV